MYFSSVRACPADLCHARRNFYLLFLVSLLIATEGKACNFKSRAVIHQPSNSSCWDFSPSDLIKFSFLSSLTSGGHVQKQRQQRQALYVSTLFLAFQLSQVYAHTARGKAHTPPFPSLSAEPGCVRPGSSLPAASQECQEVTWVEFSLSRS